MPVGPINDLSQVFEHPQVKSRGLQLELPHPLAGSVPSVANPIRMSATPPRYETAPPTARSAHARSAEPARHRRARAAGAGARRRDLSRKKSLLRCSRRRVSCGGRRAKIRKVRLSKCGCGTRPRRRASPAGPCARSRKRRTPSSRRRCAWRRDPACRSRSNDAGRRSARGRSASMVTFMYTVPSWPRSCAPSGKLVSF